MTQDNKLVEHAYNRYMDLKDRLKDLENEHRTLYIRYSNERDARQRDMAKKDLVINERRIQEVKQEMNKIKNQIHLKDSIDILKLSGFTVDSRVCENKDSLEFQINQLRQKIKNLYDKAGDALNEKNKEKYNIIMSQIKIEEKNLNELIRASNNDSCGEKVYTKGTEDADLSKISKNWSKATIEHIIKNAHIFKPEVVEEAKRLSKTVKDAERSVIWVKPSGIEYKVGDVIQYKGNQVRVTKINGNVVEAEVMGKAEDACSNKDSATQKECNEILKLSGFIS